MTVARWAHRRFAWFFCAVAAVLVTVGAVAIDDSNQVSVLGFDVEGLALFVAELPPSISTASLAIRERIVAPVPAKSPRNSHALVIGDSQPDSYWDALRDGLAEHGWSADRSIFSGASACDFAANGPSNQSFQASVGVVSFRGNSYTTCARDANRDPKLVAEQTALSVEYVCESSGFDICVVVGQPAEAAPSDLTIDVSLLNELLRDVVARHSNYVFADCGAAVDTPDGEFDPSTRDVDGVHLNATGKSLTAGCIVSYFGTSTTP